MNLLITEGEPATSHLHQGKWLQIESPKCKAELQKWRNQKRWQCEKAAHMASTLRQSEKTQNWKESERISGCQGLPEKEAGAGAGAGQFKSLLYKWWLLVMIDWSKAIGYLSPRVNSIAMHRLGVVLKHWGWCITPLGCCTWVRTEVTKEHSLPCAQFCCKAKTALKK